MNIAYVLDRPELCGGVKVVFQHANLLRRLGHDVIVLAHGRKPSWSLWRGRYINLDDRLPRLPDQDIVIATYWSTVADAEKLGIGPVIHFCQGYEGDYPHLVDQVAAIEKTYARSFPTFVVSPHLGHMLKERFGRRSIVTPPPLDPVFHANRKKAPRSRPRIAVHGIFECTWKGVATGLQAVHNIRNTGLPCRLIRFSLLPLSASEKALLDPDRFYYQVSPRATASKLRNCDLLLFPSLEAEGFGLPLLEAMASGVPAVASDIAATRFVTGGAIELLTPGDASAFADAAINLLADDLRWREARDIGLEAAKKFSETRITLELEKALRWAIDPKMRETP